MSNAFHKWDQLHRRLQVAVVPRVRLMFLSNINYDFFLPLERVIVFQTSPFTPRPRHVVLRLAAHRQQIAFLLGVLFIPLLMKVP